MTLGTPDQGPPDLEGADHDDEHVVSADRQATRTEDRHPPVARVSNMINSRDEQTSGSAEQQDLIGLASGILTSWPNTWRAVLLFTVLVCLLGGLLWLVPMDIEIGMIRIVPR
jgi:hypothetical protein